MPTGSSACAPKSRRCWSPHWKGACSEAHAGDSQHNNRTTPSAQTHEYSRFPNREAAFLVSGRLSNPRRVWPTFAPFRPVGFFLGPHPKARDRGQRGGDAGKRKSGQRLAAPLSNPQGLTLLWSGGLRRPPPHRCSAGTGSRSHRRPPCTAPGKVPPRSVSGRDIPSSP